MKGRSDSQIHTASIPVPEVASPFPAGSGTCTAMRARSLAGIPSGAVSGMLLKPGAPAMKVSRSVFWIEDKLLAAPTPNLAAFVSAIRLSASILARFWMSTLS